MAEINVMWLILISSKFLVVAVQRNLPAGSIISNCLSLDTRKKLSFSCPRNHVLDDIHVVYGARLNSQSLCRYSPENCHVTHTQFMKWTDRCLWRQSCKLLVQDFILSDSDNTTNLCNGRRTEYISFVPPNCVHKDTLFQACPIKNEIISVGKGIIHMGCPSKSLNTTTMKCRRRMRLQQNTTVAFLLRGSGESAQTRITWNYRGDVWKKTLKEGKVMTLIASNSFIRIRLKKQGIQPVSTKFRLYFRVVDKTTAVHSQFFHDFQDVNVVTARVLTDMRMHQREHYTLTCPKAHLVTHLDMHTAVWSRHTNTSIQRPQCQGLSSGLLVQKSNCYWRQSCDLKWTEPAHIISTDCVRCYGRIPNGFSLGPFKCIANDSIADICDPNTHKNITHRARGVIRSHGNYPWNYPAKRQRCQIILRIPSDEVLTLWSPKIDVWKGDKVRIYHVLNDALISFIPRKQAVELRITGGHLLIKFTVSKNSISGQGFIFLFQKDKMNMLTQVGIHNPRHGKQSQKHKKYSWCKVNLNSKKYRWKCRKLKRMNSMKKNRFCG